VGRVVAAPRRRCARTAGGVVARGFPSRGHDLVGEERRGAGFASGEPGDRAAGDIVRAVAREGGEPEDVGLAECDGFGDEALYVCLDAVCAAVLGEGGVRRLAQGLPAAGADGGARQGGRKETQL